MIVNIPTTKPGGLLRWLTEPPARSFTLFKGHPRMSRIARFIERVVFVGGGAVAVLLWLGGGTNLFGLLEALIELKVTGLILSQVAHVLVNVGRYVLVPGDRDDMRKTSEVVLRPPAPYVPDDSAFDPAGHGFPKEPDYIKPNHIPTSTTVNIPSADHGVPERFVQR